MKKAMSLVQFLPISICLGVARSLGSDGHAWSVAFQWGAIAAVIQLAILLPVLKNKMDRLVGGANLFLIVGGIGFGFKIGPILELFDVLRESVILASVGVVCILATVFTATGVFEEAFALTGNEKRYSYFYLISIAVALGFSIENRGNTLLAGVLPFISLVLLKRVLSKFNSRAIVGENAYFRSQPITEPPSK